MASSNPTSPTVADLGEFGLIAHVATEPSEFSPRVLIGPGDDAAQIATDGASLLMSADTLVSGRHFRVDWASAYDIGRRAAAANLADIAAMGGVAQTLTVSFAAPGDVAASWASDLASGIADEARLVGADVVGGDVTAASEIVIGVAVLGKPSSRVVRRCDARPGDVVALSGRIGWAAAGLAVLGRGFRAPRAAVDAFRRPEPPYAAGPQAAEAGATSMIDISDGLIADLGHIGEASGVAIDIDSAAFDIAEPLQAVGAAIGADPLSFVLTGGDDHPLAATYDPQTPLPEGWRKIGTVSVGTGVTVDGASYESAGYEHYR